MKKYFINNERGFSNEKTFVSIEKDNLEGIKELLTCSFEQTTRKDMEECLSWMRKEEKAGVSNNIRVMTYEEYVGKRC